jgi:hypothetical protein
VRRWCAAAAALVAWSLAVGVCGYHYLAGLAWIDSLLNASMIQQCSENLCLDVRAP